MHRPRKIFDEPGRASKGPANRKSQSHARGRARSASSKNVTMCCSGYTQATKKRCRRRPPTVVNLSTRTFMRRELIYPRPTERTPSVIYAPTPFFYPLPVLLFFTPFEEEEKEERSYFFAEVSNLIYSSTRERKVFNFVTLIEILS